MVLTPLHPQFRTQGQHCRPSSLPIGRVTDTPAGTELGKFLAPHGLALGRYGDICVGEVSWIARPQIYPGQPHPANLRALQKFGRVE
jgi:hypothetical protein